ncbi:putative ferulic acid Esterase/Feruloyl esterase [Myriangium duriaei CBS 260.36]|uniref:Carboxylic ester hydrolase n=1 Tax=Myriangium duriaei CBS 260.36 TaxID=1168546 RepID=A0A9P4IWU1_9PEZI|nr:putative ferulic acid Esterase/Feruloyl esterase [Myriangium duriaei CBS 260.36]
MCGTCSGRASVHRGREDSTEVMLGFQHISTSKSPCSNVGETAALLDCTPAAFSSLLSPGATVVAATTVQDNGTFQVPPGNIAYPTSPTGLKALCALQVQVPSSNSSFYQFGLFLPNQWNHRFLAVGNGGLAGGINWLDMGTGVGYGFASISTDTGHNSSALNGTWGLNQPEKLIDWGYRAMHGSVVAAKQIVKGYYRSDIAWSYYSGCSTGGRQGLKDMQLYPEDFDGVLAGCAAWWSTHLQTWTVKVSTYNLPVDGPNRIPVSKFSVIEKEIQRQCDPQDGVRDGIISDPRGCNLYLNALLCPANATSNATASCLTPPQIQTLRNIYSDYYETNNTFVFPRFEPGSEAQWPLFFGGPGPVPLGYDYVKDWLLNDTTWTYDKFNYSIVQLADRINPSNSTADNFDLSAFRARGGKLITYHGTADALIPTGSSVYFREAVETTMRSKGVNDIDDFFRFFLAPGMQHCGGTPPIQQAPWYFAGPNQAGMVDTSLHSTPGFNDPRHDILLALMEWTEHGTPPDDIIATTWKNNDYKQGVQKQRPICPYPKKPVFLGGNLDEAGNWECADDNPHL